MAERHLSIVRKPNTRQRSIAEAIKITKKLTRPPGITPYVWHGVHAVLIELARHIPDAFPSEERLAERTGYSRPSIERYIRAARKSGLIEVERFQHGRGWRRNRYILTWLNIHQADGLYIHQPDALKQPLLRRGSSHPFGVKKEPPSAAAAAGRTQTNTLDEQPNWWTGWDPVKQLGLPSDTVWKRNLYAGKCACCVLIVPPKAGWIAPSYNGNTWLVVHDEVCPRMREGTRPGQRRVYTAGDIHGDSSRFRR